jgi:hypothetical protein
MLCRVRWQVGVGVVGLEGRGRLMCCIGSTLFLSAMKSHYWEETKGNYDEGEPIF